jgi:hypothetical protein
MQFCVSIHSILLAKSVYQPLDKQKVYTNCSDALVRGGILPNPGQPVSIIFKVNIFLYSRMFRCNFYLSLKLVNTKNDAMS